MTRSRNQNSCASARRRSSARNARAGRRDPRSRTDDRSSMSSGEPRRDTSTIHLVPNQVLGRRRCSHPLLNNLRLPRCRRRRDPRPRDSFRTSIGTHWSILGLVRWATRHRPRGRLRRAMDGRRGVRLVSVRGASPLPRCLRVQTGTEDMDKGHHNHNSRPSARPPKARRRLQRWVFRVSNSRKRSV